MDELIEHLNARIEQMAQTVDQNFAEVDRRLEALEGGEPSQDEEGLPDGEVVAGEIRARHLENRTMRFAAASDVQFAPTNWEEITDGQYD